MKKSENKTTYFFVDEAGDPTFYNRKGKLIVGQSGCSKILLLGFIKTNEPDLIRQKVNKLRQEILEDSYLNNILSVKNRSAKVFHATDDIPEVREKVYRLIKTLPLKSEFILARKIEKIFQSKHQSSENIFYDDLIIKLFKSQLHQSTKNIIYFSVRGNKARQLPLEEAIRTSINTFEEQWKVKINSEILVFPQSPKSEPCLQIIDYLSWAVQRAYIKKETRYFDFIGDKISLIADIYDFKKYPNTYYNSSNHFNLSKISPL